MAPHLLSLPAEIRNCIYEYALTEEDGLVYMKDEDGVGRLYPGNFKELAETQAKDYAWETYGRYQSDQSDEEFQDQRKKDFPCFIPWVEYGISIRKLGVANQLQFVCHQLHKETSGLDLQHNRVMFFDGSNDRPLGNCVSFLRGLKAHNKENIKVMVMPYEEDWLESEANIFELLRFCKDHSKSRIDIYLPELAGKPLDYLFTAQNMVTFLGKAFPILAQVQTEFRARLQSNAEGVFREWNRRKLAEAPSNLRVFPKPIEFDEDSLRDSIVTDDEVLSVMEDIGIDAYVAWVKDWVQNGV